MDPRPLTAWCLKLRRDYCMLQSPQYSYNGAATARGSKSHAAYRFEKVGPTSTAKLLRTDAFSDPYATSNAPIKSNTLWPEANTSRRHSYLRATLDGAIFPPLQLKGICRSSIATYLVPFHVRYGPVLAGDHFWILEFKTKRRRADRRKIMDF